MPNCSAPGCRGNYTPEDRVPVFKLPDGPPEYNIPEYVLSIVTIFLI